MPLVPSSKPHFSAHLRPLWRPARCPRHRQRFGMARGPEAAGPDRGPLGVEHVPARCRRGAGRRSDAGRGGLGVLRTPRHALERRDGADVRDEHPGWRQAAVVRPSVRAQRGPGPGRVALSRDAPGELIVLPVDAPKEIDVREHALVLATGTLTYSFEKLPGLRAMMAAGTGMYLDRYVAQSGAGLIVLHGYGNVFERNLGESETILVDPGAFFYKDSSVNLEVVSVNFKANFEGAVAPAGAAGGRVCLRCRRGRRDAGSAGGAQPGEAQASQQGGRFGRGLRGLKAAKSMLNVGALASAAGNLRSGGGLQGVAAGLAGGGGSTLLRMSGPGRVGIQSMFKFHKSE